LSGQDAETYAALASDTVQESLTLLEKTTTMGLSGSFGEIIKHV